MKALIDLALAIKEKERTADGVSPLVEKALEKHRKESEAAASDDIVALLREIESHKLEKRQKIRGLKSSLRAEVSLLDDLDRRWAFAQKTNNFLPVLKFFNHVSPASYGGASLSQKEFNDMTEVPTDFKSE